MVEIESSNIKDPIIENGEVRFYRPGPKNGIFSNFEPCPVLNIHDKDWPTTEHYFQAMKFKDTEKEEKIRLANSPGEAFRLGQERDPNFPLPVNWNEDRIDVMRTAVLEKFRQNPHFKKFLLATGTNKIIEDTHKDKFWANGGDGSGKNMLGIILMETRDKLLKEQEPEQEN